MRNSYFRQVHMYFSTATDFLNREVQVDKKNTGANNPNKKRITWFADPQSKLLVIFLKKHKAENKIH